MSKAIDACRISESFSLLHSRRVSSSYVDPKVHTDHPPLLPLSIFHPLLSNFSNKRNGGDTRRNPPTLPPSMRFTRHLSPLPLFFHQLNQSDPPLFDPSFYLFLGAIITPRGSFHLFIYYYYYYYHHHLAPLFPFLIFCCLSYG